MNKHTPGPWQYVFEGGTTAFITEADGSTIICIRTTENTTAHKDLVANACLIAAAPELLEAVKYCRQKIAYMTEHGEWYSPGRAIEKADAAIAKATGGVA